MKESEMFRTNKILEANKKKMEVKEMPCGNNIEPHQYHIQFTFVNPKDMKHYQLKMRTSEAFYDVEQDYIRLEGEDGEVKYLATLHTNREHYDEVEDMLRSIFTAIYTRTNILMKSKLLEKIKV